MIEDNSYTVTETDPCNPKKVTKNEQLLNSIEELDSVIGRLIRFGDRVGGPFEHKGTDNEADQKSAEDLSLSRTLEVAPYHIKEAANAIQAQITRLEELLF